MVETKEILDAAQAKMDKVIGFLTEELTSVRAGKASTNILNGIMVDYYGTPTPVSQVASITVPDARTVLVQPWEKKMIAPLEKALNDWVSRIRPGGRMCVITFHSIEDRIVKRVFRTMQNPCICPPKAPICTCGRVPIARVMGGGAIKPTAEELSRNSRAHSATLRVVQKL